MNFKLNFWQTLCLFLPMVIGLILMDIPYAAVADHSLNLLSIANVLLVVNCCIVILYQTMLALRFNYTSGVKSNLFKWNALIPAIFISAYLLYVLYTTVNRPATHTRHNYGPMKITQYNTTGLLILLFLFHAFITFYLINNEFVSRQIKNKKDYSEQAQLRAEFLIPMRRLVKVSLWVIGSMLLLSTVIDLIVFQ